MVFSLLADKSILWASENVPQSVSLWCPELKKHLQVFLPSLGHHFSVISDPFSGAQGKASVMFCLTKGVSRNAVALGSQWPWRINHWKEPENPLNLEYRGILTQAFFFSPHSFLSETSCSTPRELQNSHLLHCSFPLPLRWAFSS